MSFAANHSQQLSLFDATSNLTEREKRLLEKSWAKYFAENIFPAIDEKPFAVLYSDRPSRHNTPVNVIIGALILKEIFGLTDEELVDTLPFDIRYQYALHTTSFEEQPLNDRTLGRFRARCNSYEELTGEDLIRDCADAEHQAAAVDEAEYRHTPDGLPDGGVQHQKDEPSGTPLYLCGEPCEPDEETGRSGTSGYAFPLYGS